MKLEVMALDVGSILLDSLRAPERAAAKAEELCATTSRPRRTAASIA